MPADVKTVLHLIILSIDVESGNDKSDNNTTNIEQWLILQFH